MFEFALFSNEWMTITGLTLLHSLWQLTLLVLLASVIVRLLPNLSAGAKYKIYYATYVLSAVLVMGTFGWYHSFLPDTMLFHEPVVADTAISYDPVAVAADTQTTTGFQWDLTVVSGALALLWLLGLGVVILMKFTGWHLSRRLRVRGTSAISEVWESRLQQLQAQVQVGRQVTMKLSALVKSPMMIGYLKPVILVPVGFFTSLSTDEVESIILHELAHIKRNDYLHMLFQQVLNTLFFFHPASWVLNRLINDERENACDDFVVATTGNAYTYIMALGQMQMNLSNTQNKMTMNLMNDKNKVLNRLKRLVGEQPSQKAGIRMLILPVLILLSGICLFFAPEVVQAGETRNLADQPVFATNEMVADTIARPRKTKEKTKNRKAETKEDKVKVKAPKKKDKQKSKEIRYSADGVIFEPAVAPDEKPSVKLIAPAVVEVIEEDGSKSLIEVIAPTVVEEPTEIVLTPNVIVEEFPEVTELQEVILTPSVVVEEIPATQLVEVVPAPGMLMEVSPAAPTSPTQIIEVISPDTIPADQKAKMIELEKHLLEMQERMLRLQEEQKAKAEEMRRMAEELMLKHRKEQLQKMQKIKELQLQYQEERKPVIAELQAKREKERAERAKEMALKHKMLVEKAKEMAEQQQEHALRQVQLAQRAREYEEKSRGGRIRYDELVETMNNDGLKVKNGEKLSFELTDSKVLLDKAVLSDKLARKYRRLLKGYLHGDSGKIELSPKRVVVEMED